MVDLEGASASNNGTQPPVVERRSLNVTALSAATVQIPGGLQLPLEMADAGTVSQYAAANPDGSSVGASGAVAEDGGIGTNAVPAEDVPGAFTIGLSEVVGSLNLDPALLAEVADLNLTVGAISARAAQAAPGAAEGDYEITDLSLDFQSPTIAALTGTINGAVAALQTQLGGLDVGLEAAIADLPGVGAGADVDVTVTVPPLADEISGILAEERSSGGITLDLATGRVTVDLAMLSDLNNLAPSTDLLTPAQIAAIGDNITLLVAGLVTEVGAALQAAVDDSTVTGGASAGGVDLVDVDTTLGALLAGSTAGLTLPGLLLPGGVDDVLAALLGPIDAIADLDDIAGLLDTLVLTPVVNLVAPAVGPVLSAALRLTVNVQETAAGVFTETALRVTVLPLTAALVGNIASASAGPNVAVADPAVTGITPTSGPETGGTEVTLTGSGFGGTTSVTIGGIAVAPTTATPTSIVFVTPPHVAEVVDVVVNAPQGNSAPVDFEYLPVAADAASLTPTEGTELGGTPVTITGSGFLGATGVEFDGVAGTDFTVVNGTTITVTSPPHSPGDVEVVVLDPAGDSGPLAYEFLAIASVATALDPTFGPVEGGTAVTVTGSGFTGATGVDFDGTPGTAFVVVDDGTITVTSPAHSAGVVDVVVLDPAGNSGPLDFEFGAVPSSATSLTPTAGPEAGGTEVTISGSGFTGATGVTFDGIAGTGFTVVNDGTITVLSPAHAPGLVDVIVVDAAGSSDPLAFTFEAEAAAITGIDPARGPLSGGTEVTITGSGFTGSTGVTFGGVAATSFTVVDDNTITAVTPAGASGTVDVVVLDPAGNSAPVDFEYYVLSRIANVTPDSGTTGGGTSVRITGECFTGAAGVLFGTTPARSFTVNGAGTVITAVTPAGTGTVDVTVLGAGECGSASLDNAFEYVAPALAPTGTSIAGALWVALVLLIGGAGALLIRNRMKSHKMTSK
jgi:hypothetical protein